MSKVVDKGIKEYKTPENYLGSVEKQFRSTGPTPLISPEANQELKLMFQMSGD